MTDNNTCTIVTCYYKFPSKHSFENYDKWMSNFLITIDNPMVIFCDNTMISKIKELRKHFESKTYIICLPFHETYCAQEKYMNYWKKDWERDIEKHLHNPNLYIVWNEKCKFVEKSIQLNPFNTNFFMWCDMGCFRSKEDLKLFKQWPAVSFLNRARTDKMYFLNIVPFQSNDFVLLPNQLSRSFEREARIGGTIFLGHKDAFLKYINLFYETMDLYIQHNYFTGKDQNIIATCYIKNPELFELILPKINEGDPWFYLQRYFNA